MEFQPLPLTSERKGAGGFEPLPLVVSQTDDTKQIGSFEPLPLQSSEKPIATKTIEEAPFEARHPNVYGAWGVVKETAKSLVPYLKYVDPDERERFKNLVGYGEDGKWYQPKTKEQAQVRELLWQNLEAVGMLAFDPLVEGVKPVVSEAMKRWLPKTYSVLTKPIGKGAIKVAEAIPEKPIDTPTAKPIPTPTPAEKAQGVALGKTVTPVTQETPVQKVMAALKEAKPVRAEQEALYTKARGERITKAIDIGQQVPGEAGYYAKLSKMAGPMERVEFHAIRGKIGQQEIDALFGQVNESAAIGEFEKLTAGRGLAKFFGEFGGSVPTKGELELLHKVFGQEFVETALSKRPLFAKAKDVGLELANIPRAIMSSFDVSAPLRQGVFLIGRPKQFAPAFRDMFKYLVDEKAFATLNENIVARPTYQLMKDTRLAITELGKNLTGREERFMSSYAEKIPIIGRGVRASGRAYTGFLNKLRADVFDDFVKKGAELGIDDPKFLKDAANFINHATGRGTLGSLEKVAVPLNAFFFSPRLMASRLNLVNPVFYAKLHPKVRKEALKSLFTFGATASTVAGLAVLNGAKVGTDPRSADFMKLKFGNTRYDILGGFQQPIRAAAQFISGEIVSSTTGKVMTLGEGYKPLTRTDIISRYLESKEAPLISFATALLRGRTTTGELVDIPTEVANRFIPMAAQDMVDLYKEQGLKGIPMGSPALFGVGVMSYGGVQSYGLNGKNYPVLNAELNRLKTSMGYPSTTAFGQELTNKEYKLLKEETGKEIAKNLMGLISRPEYKSLDDKFKVQKIEMFVDIIKDKVKMRLFKNKKIESEIRSGFKASKGMTAEEAKQAAKDFMAKRMPAILTESPEPLTEETAEF